jgi:hypothetical protein
MLVSLVAAAELQPRCRRRAAAKPADLALLPVDDTPE